MHTSWLSYHSGSTPEITARGNLAHAVTARKEIWIKFSHIANNFLTFNMVLALLFFDSWLSWFYTNYLSTSARRNSRFLFIKDLLLFISSVMQSVRYNCESCFLFCPLRQKNWQNVDRSSKRTTQLYSAHYLNPYPQMLKNFSTAVYFSIFHCLFFHLAPSLTFTLK